LWAVLTAYGLLLAIRLDAPATKRCPGRAWLWLLRIVVAAIVIAHVYYWSSLTGFLQWGDWAVAVWFVPLLLSIALVIQAKRMLVTEIADADRPRRLRLFFRTALAETVLFVLVDGFCLLLLLFAIADAASDHD